MQVDIFDTYAEFSALEDNWNSVFVNDPYANFFLSWSWLSCIFREYPGEWRVLAARSTETNTYVGFLPVNTVTVWSKRRNRFRNELNMAGTQFWSQYTGFVCDAEWDAQAIPSIGEKLQELYWSRISLKYIHASKDRLQLFASSFPGDRFITTHHERWINKGETNNLICPYIELPNDYQDYLQSHLGSNTRQKIRRYTRKLQTSGEYSFSTANAQTVDRDIDILTRLWLEKWAESKGKKADGLARKFCKILRYSFSIDSLYLPVLWKDNIPVAAIANFVDWEKKSVFFFVVGRDEKREEKWIGLIMNAHCISWAIDNRMKIYDFCHGNEAYKYSFGAQDRVLEHIVVSHKSGRNLNGILDPKCTEEVMDKTIKLIQSNELDQAVIACKQIRDITRNN